MIVAQAVPTGNASGSRSMRQDLTSTSRACEPANSSALKPED
jgi:hypothetical protein